MEKPAGHTLKLASRLAPIAALVAGLACNFAVGGTPALPATPRPEDIQTAIAQTQASGQIPPLSSPAPDATLPPAESSPAAPGGGERPAEEAILILEPGPNSQVTSPVHIAGVADPTFEQTLLAQIVGQDGAEIARSPVTIAADVGQRGEFAFDLEFAVPADQPGRIAVSSYSPRDGGLTHLASVEVTLLAGGAASLQPARRHPEEISLTQPAPGAAIRGGTLQIVGFAGPAFEQSLAVEIRDESGQIVGSGTVIVNAEAGQPGAFQTEVGYAVTNEQPGRVSVYSTSARDGGIIHLASTEVILAP